MLAFLSNTTPAPWLKTCRRCPPACLRWRPGKRWPPSPATSSGAALVFGWMHYVSDPQTGKLITPHEYYTDGEWVWPAYLPHYLGTRSLGAHYANFVAHARDCRFVLVSKTALAAIEEELSRLL